MLNKTAVAETTFFCCFIFNSQLYLSTCFALLSCWSFLLLAVLSGSCSDDASERRGGTGVYMGEVGKRHWRKELERQGGVYTGNATSFSHVRGGMVGKAGAQNKDGDAMALWELLSEC